MHKKIIKIVFIVFLFLSASPLTTLAGGLKHGVYKAYYSNGALRMKTKYKKGQLIYKNIYFKNGHLSKQYVYKGKQRIKSRTYYENGQLQSVWSKKSGEARYYSQQGSLKAVVKDRPNEALIKKLPASLL